MPNSVLLGPFKEHIDLMCCETYNKNFTEVHSRLDCEAELYIVKRRYKNDK